MENFKLSTTTIYRHSLIAPKGYIFNKEVILESNIFDPEKLKSLEVKHSGSVLRWEEYYTNFSGGLGEDFYAMYLTVESGCLVKVA